MINISGKYRLKAFACEAFARDATCSAIRMAWTEIAIECHALANRTARETAQCSKSPLKPNSSAEATS